MSNAKTARPSILQFEFHADASGAPAVLECAGYRFACDLLGEIKMNLLSGPPAGRAQNRIAAERIRAYYQTALEQYTTADWRAANARMYAE